VTGLGERVSASAESDNMSLSADRHKCLSSGKTTQARKSRNEGPTPCFSREFPLRSFFEVTIALLPNGGGKWVIE
jgi:hypothetical protein